MNNKIWIGTKESDIYSTGKFFRESITACGNGNSGNHSFSTRHKMRINYNKENIDYAEFLSGEIKKLVQTDPTAEIMYYNPYYAYALEQDLQKHVCCLNSRHLLEILRSKCEMRILASEHIPVVPFTRVPGRDIESILEPGELPCIIQQNISSGGEGTYIVSSKNKLPCICGQDIYLVSDYYEKNIPININFIIFDDSILLFPPSVQIVQQNNDKLMFYGSDYFIEQYQEHFQIKDVYDYTLKIARILKKMGYRGICGFDFIACSEGLLFLECNPRFQASTFLINLALKQNGFPSVQEMNYMAFQHISAPSFDFMNLKIPYSCIAVSYRQYLDNYIIRSEWQDDCNVVEILMDGLMEDVKCENDAYLYRIVFSSSVTALTPESKIITYNNLVPPSEEWHSKILSGDILALKISLLNQGVYITQNTLAFLEKTGGIKSSVFDSIDIILPDRMIVNCPYKINYADFSPFSIRIFNEKTALYYYNRLLYIITLEKPDPGRYYYTKENHIPYRRLAYLGGDRLRIHHTDICIYKKQKTPCEFCNLPNDDFVYSMADIREVLDYYLKKGGFRHILIGGGSEPIGQEYRTVLELVKYIRTYTDMPIYVMCLPVPDNHILLELYQAGVTEIGFNLELWDEQTSRKYMPGKGKLSRQFYLTALSEAKKLWQSRFAVRTLMIIGLEELQTVKYAIHTLCSQGIMPVLSVFRPLPNTKMQSFLPPENEWLYSAYIELEQICNSYGQHLGPDCYPCQNNTLALPW